MSARFSTCRSQLALGFILALLLFAAAVPVQVQDTQMIPLAAPGPYLVGTREMTYIDEARDGREVAVTIWYPAVDAAENAAADPSQAPYPLILYTIGRMGNRMELRYLDEHLASQGFVVAAMEPGGRNLSSYREAVNQPLDVLFMLNQLADAPPQALTGMIDADHTGVMGYSFGGYTAVAVSGAQWDSGYHATWCTSHPDLYPEACPGQKTMEMVWDYRAQTEPAPADGELWPPMTDARIRAVLPLAGAPGMVFGERGLAEADVPMLMMAATHDTDTPYEPAAAFVYENWGDADHYLLTFVGADHNFGYRSVPNSDVDMIDHFATAFFGLYLQNRHEYAEYLTVHHVNACGDLYSGVYVPPL